MTIKVNDYVTQEPAEKKLEESIIGKVVKINAGQSPISLYVLIVYAPEGINSGIAGWWLLGSSRELPAQEVQSLLSKRFRV